MFKSIQIKIINIKLQIIIKIINIIIITKVCKFQLTIISIRNSSSHRIHHRVHLSIMTCRKNCFFHNNALEDQIRLPKVYSNNIFKSPKTNLKKNSFPLITSVTAILSHLCIVLTHF